MAYINAVLARREYLEERISQLSSKLKDLPNAKIYCYNIKGYSSWLIKWPNEKRKYLPKSERKLAEAVAARGLFEATLKDLKAELKAINRFIKDYEKLRFPAGLEYYARSPEHRNLLAPIFNIEDDNVKDFVSKEYNSAPHQENRTIVCKNGLKVRSKSENMLADTFFSYRIPFQYEPRIVLEASQNAIAHPDFRLFDYIVGKLYIHEHFGMMDNPKYAAVAAKKIEEYAKNGYYIGENLIVTFETSTHKLSSAEIEEIIHQYFPWATDIR